jgi:hypothetical protein
MDGLIVLEQEIVAAGKRHSNALRLENEFRSLYSKHKTDDVWKELRTAQILVDRSTKAYAAAVGRYLETLREFTPEANRAESAHGSASA